MISQQAAVIRTLGVASMLAVMFALSACGEYSPIADDTETQTQDATDTADPTETGDATDVVTPTPDPEETVETTTYAWGLPPTDTSVTGNDGPAYGSLLFGCDSAQAYLDATADQYFWGFTNPRYVALYMAGLEQCRGNVARAAELTTGALAVYGTEGLDRFGEPNQPGTSEPYPTPLPPGYGEPECDLYRSLVSVRDQVSPDSLDCPAGDRPGYTLATYALTDTIFIDVYDDPCTADVDESLIPPTEFVYPPTSFCGPEHPGESQPIPRSDG